MKYCDSRSFDQGRGLKRFWLSKYGAHGALNLCLAIALLAIGLWSPLTAQELAALNLKTPILPASPANVGTGAIMAPPTHTNHVIGSPVAQASYLGCTSCGGGGCDSCGGGGAVGPVCTPPSIGLWMRVDYLRLWEKGGSVPPLVTNSNGFPADPQDLLTLSASETSVLFGGDEVDDNPFGGLRVELGTWVDAAATTGIYGRYLMTDDRSVNYATDFTEEAFLGIPFFDSDSNSEDAFDLTIPNERFGDVSVDIDTSFEAWELLVRRVGKTGCNYRVDWVYGYRHVDLDESLQLTANTTVSDAAAGIVGTVITVNDQFRVDNRFDAFDFGITGHSHQGHWSLDFLVKVALGNMSQEIDIQGSQLVSVPGIDTTTLVGGLLSQESNIGSHEDDTFTWMPEVNVNIGYAITSNLDLTFGYTFMYIGDLLRAGDVIDRVVDPGLAVDLDPVNGNRPAVVRDQSSYWLQGLNFGLTGRF